MRTSKGATVRIGCRRHDWTNALFDGKVAAGRTYELDVRELDHVGIDRLLGASSVADYAECTWTGVIEARARGVPVLALPIFIRTTFRHSYILARTDRGIEGPKDLEGKRVGTNYTVSATVWIRGLFQDEYGVQLDKIHWVNQGPGPEYPPPGLALESVPRDVNLHEWLRDGRVDALVLYDAELFRFLGDSRVKRLFPKAGQEERRWWRKTHIMPMMDVIACPEAAIKDRLDEAREVFDAFVEAKEIGKQALLSNRDSGLAWYWEAVEDQLQVLGPDPVPYSVGKNRHAIETFHRYCAEQGLVDRQLGVEEVFFAGFDR